MVPVYLHYLPLSRRDAESVR